MSFLRYDEQTPRRVAHSFSKHFCDDGFSHDMQLILWSNWFELPAAQGASNRRRRLFTAISTLSNRLTMFGSSSTVACFLPDLIDSVDLIAPTFEWERLVLDGRIAADDIARWLPWLPQEPMLNLDGLRLGRLLLDVLLPAPWPSDANDSCREPILALVEFWLNRWLIDDFPSVRLLFDPIDVREPFDPLLGSRIEFSEVCDFTEGCDWADFGDRIDLFDFSEMLEDFERTDGADLLEWCNLMESPDLTDVADLTDWFDNVLDRLLTSSSRITVSLIGGSRWPASLLMAFINRSEPTRNMVLGFGATAWLITLPSRSTSLSDILGLVELEAMISSNVVLIGPSNSTGTPSNLARLTIICKTVWRICRLMVLPTFGEANAKSINCGSFNSSVCVDDIQIQTIATDQKYNKFEYKKIYREFFSIKIDIDDIDDFEIKFSFESRLLFGGIFRHFFDHKKGKIYHNFLENVPRKIKGTFIFLMPKKKLQQSAVILCNYNCF